MAELSPEFILNMTSDAKVRIIVEKIRKLSNITTRPPEMTLYNDQFDPEQCPGTLLPFTCYVITGTAGAGKSTSISALYQNLNCLITGATTVASQNLSRCLKTYCPTIFNAFGFKSKHINILPRSVPRRTLDTIEQIQNFELCKYWPILTSIIQEFSKKKNLGQYSSISLAAFNMLAKMTTTLWTTNVIVIDEAGTLSSHILTAVVFCYWFYNSWLNTPLYRSGAVPCIVCVGSPTQTDAFNSTYNHIQQKYNIMECDNILSFIIGNKVVSEYISLTNNWALFINNKRCTDPEFGHLLKTLEYSLKISPKTMEYIDRFVVPKAQILNPLEFLGWTRLFLSHAEVKSYLSSLHTALVTGTNVSGAKLFTCPIVCEVFTKAFNEYKSHVNLPSLTATEWLSKNLHRLSNYSQFIDQDMTAIHTETTDTSTKVTYLTKYVKNTYISLNGKTKKCVCGYVGTYKNFKKILESESFIDSHANDQPEFVYSFLCTILYNSLYNFHNYGVTEKNESYLNDLANLKLPENLTHLYTQTDLDIEREALMLEDDVFYHMVSPPPTASSASLPCLISWYTALKDIFISRLKLATTWFSNKFLDREFTSFTINMLVRDNIEFTSTNGRLHGLLEYASTVESYKLQGYTFLPVNFGRSQTTVISKDLQDKMPSIVVQDSSGFIACLEKNVNKMLETLDDGKSFHLCSAGDYGISSKLAMTIVKAQGTSLDKVAICFSNHKKIKVSHIYVAISRATNPNHIVMDCNPLKLLVNDTQSISSQHIIKALNNPNTLLVY
ncbi:helicase [Saimiriine gammaherpesvirus 2]|uniref:DNA replication helicase n=1 Tax=Saimiriine herpesvirus 2 (strain 11) TaxID=10383 RepID=HELI_SHV21|nr:helicase [Saimiriine gammaherpesvirus 2]Q01014.1 RecName: Full=DNA replication helicase [Herpesvirus saimiri (strain 11)]pir/QQBEN7/ helicase (EC 3.6.1.-) - saimiriine herpesvirus 1 (strain 11) [Saimiriine alphaherpesvirus 1]CAA45666.1 helicase [Saimiriine gammaherpesvirus 2]